MPKIGFFDTLGGLAGGYVQGQEAEARRRLLQQQYEQLAQQQSGQQDAGSALMTNAGVAPPQTSAVPGATPFGGMMSKLGGLFTGGQAPASAPSPNALAARPAGPQPPQPGPQPQAGGAPQPPLGAPPPPQQGAPPQGQPQGGQPQGGPPPQMQQAVGRLDFPTLVNTLAKQPGMTPQRLMAAMSALAPYMNIQAQMDYKQAMLRIAGQNSQSRADDVGSNIQHRAHEDKVADAKLDQSAQRMAEHKAEFDAKFAEFQQSLQLHANSQDENARLRALTQAESNFRGLMTVRAAVANNDPNDPQLKAIDAEMEKARGELDQAHETKPDMSKSVAPQGGAKPDVQGGTVKVTTPEQAAKLPAGTRYVTPDGTEYTR